MPAMDGGVVELSVLVPADIRPLCRSMSVVGNDVPPDMVAFDFASIEPALARFGAGFWQPDRRAVASLWSMYYFNALIIPTAAALLGCDRILPVALAATGLALDSKGVPERLYIRDGGRPATAADHNRRFATLVDDHLVPFVAGFAGQTGLSRRLLWSNAATVLDYTVATVAGRALAEPKAEADGLLAGTSLARFPQLADPFRTAPDGTRERKICCIRYLLSGVAACPTICPARDASMGIRSEGMLRRGPDDDID